MRRVEHQDSPAGRGSDRAADRALLQAIRRGDVGAFDQLYQRHAPGLLGFILLRVPNRSEAEELLQETFIRLLRDKHFEPEQAGLGTYLYVIARNLSSNFVRDHGARRRLAREEHPDSDSPVWLQELESPDARIGRAQELMALREALEVLPTSQKSAFLLRHHQGYSYQEIAELEECPVGTAKSRVHLAIQGLRQALAPLLDNVRPLHVSRRG